MNSTVINATDASFEKDVLGSALPVLVDFWAPWCGPCRMVGPVVEELSQEYGDRVRFVKVNTDENMDTSLAYGIQSIPTLAIFRDGKLVDGVLGAVPKKMLETLIKKYLEPVVVTGGVK
jgi:thioredoxin 1